MLLTGVIAGCDDDAAAPNDLSAHDDLSVQRLVPHSPPPDLSVVPALDLDVAPTFDLAWTACAGSSVAGTCVAAFFQPFAECFHPEGHCGANIHNGGSEYGWQNGAYAFLGRFGAGDVYMMGQTKCLTVTAALDTASGYEFQYCSGSDPDCGFVRTEHDGGLPTYVFLGHGLLVDNNGVFTCPDGTQVDASWDCTLLNELMDPAAPFYAPYEHELCDGTLPFVEPSPWP